MFAISKPSVEILASLTLPEVVEYRLKHDPDHPFTFFPGKSASEKPSRITYLEFGRAAQRFARIVQSGTTLKKGQVVGLIANCDALLYITAIVGFAHAGITVFPMSPRNSGAAVNSMLRKVSAHSLVVTSLSVKPLLDEVQRELATDNHQLDIIELPSLPNIYPRLACETENDPFEPMPMADRADFTGDIVLYIHSSGSTGHPKPIPWTHNYLGNIAHTATVEHMRERPTGTILASPGLPSFHTMGILSYLQFPILSGTPGAMFAPTHPNPPPVSSPETIIAATRAVGATAAIMVPSILEELSHDEEALAYLSNLTRIGFGGGPLSKPVGNKLAKAGVRLRSVYGSTECGVVGSMWSSQPEAIEDWEWMSIPNLNIQWDWQPDGSAELRFLPAATHTLAVQNMPGGGYATSDLWMPHPKNSGLWRIVGRVDDVLILANGEKVVPGPTEGALLAHPFVHGAVMFGRERNQVGVLIEPVESHAFDPADESALAAFRNAVWATVNQANAAAPAFGRIYKEMILVTHPQKPLPRAAKGTVNHKAAIKAYEQEIDAIYEAVERPSHGSSVPPPENWTNDEVLSWLIKLANSIREDKQVDPDSDLFQQGFDSLSATFLRNNITAALRASSDAAVVGVSKKLGASFIYNHPTLNAMAPAIVSLLHPDEAGASVDPVSAIRTMVQRYTQDMPSVQPSKESKPAQEIALLTGSTGGLGSQLLAGLLSEDKVVKVYALNRASTRASPLQRHEATFRDRGLNTELLESPKLVFLEGQAASEHLGLSSDQYEELRSSVTMIIHNAWQLNFNLMLSSFESHIQGTRRLVDLALSSPLAEHVRVLFTSSIAVSASWPHDQGAFPEEPQEEAKWSIGAGYGEGKYVAERILVAAAKNGLQTTSFRIGQISGGYANGAWATTDWVPIMLASAVSLGSLPDAVGLASWIPFDIVSHAILDVALTSGKPQLALNLVHPHPVPWSTIIQAVADIFVEEGVTDHRLALLPMEEWVGKLTKLSGNADADTLQQVPAVKLLDFFGAMAHSNVEVRSLEDPHSESGGLTKLATDKAQSVSPALQSAASLSAKDVQRWVQYWIGKGLLVPRT